METKNYKLFKFLNIIDLKKAIILLLLLVNHTNTYSQCWQDVATGSSFAVFVSTDGRLYYTGSIGANPLAVIPNPIGTDTDWKAVAAGHAFALMLKNDNTLWGMGYNSFGQLGDGTYELRNEPVQIGNSQWKTIGAGDIHSLGIKQDGTLWTWGFNNYGQLGDTSFTTKNEPNQISSLGYWADVDGGISHSMAIQNDGTIWAWGRNNYGQLGDGTTLNANYPIEISVGNETWLSISCGGNHSGGILNDGTLWTWGANAAGQLGISSNTDSYDPIQVGNRTNWQKLFFGDRHSLAIKSDGTLWGWGHNTYGDLGLGDLLNKNLPQLVGVDIDWAFGSAGLDFTFVIKTNGEMWSWGWNAIGQLGNDSFINQEYPTLLNCPSLSVDELVYENLKVYPNPTSGILHVDKSQNSDMTIEVFDLFGKRILQLKNTETIDISAFSSGMYLIKATDGKTLQTKIQKIIKS